MANWKKMTHWVITLISMLLIRIKNSLKYHKTHVPINTLLWTYTCIKTWQSRKHAYKHTCTQTRTYRAKGGHYDNNTKVLYSNRKDTIKTAHMVYCFGIEAIWWPGSFRLCTGGSTCTVPLTFLPCTVGWCLGSPWPSRPMGAGFAPAASWACWRHQLCCTTPAKIKPRKKILS